MNFFKYLFFIISLFTCSYSFSAPIVCNQGEEKQILVPSSIINSPQQFVCKDYCQYRLKACVDVDIEGKDGLCGATATGFTCGSPPLPEEPEEPEEPDDTLECTTDSCLNPNNLRCPSGYLPGLVNGQATCQKSKPNPKPCDPSKQNCESENGDQKGVIDAVNQANTDITGSITSLDGSLGKALKSISDKLNEIAQKIGGNTNNNGNNGNNDWGNVDTSPFTADLPVRDVDRQQLSENLFISNAQCPADKVFDSTILGHSVSFSFSYSNICDFLHMFGYLVMIIAYLYAAYILSRA
ncbi:MULTISPECIES: virulence factor TspB C-terminal domain-related protein [unclassified Acinetobacter]|uniref:virulence factor TspB C-terminal domain-related protein n=1 Tax=unclassified Acinetobacter TaxID=196816 RepID=UPI0012503CB4|nr:MULTISPECIES: virulence factor TspB C-terminal domain-related protein [unclassified Acinetobacter]